MPCSPLLKGVTDPREILRIVHTTPILRYSEPPQTFYPLREKGWVEYDSGCWRITKEGYEAMPDKAVSPPSQTLADFFEL